MNKKQLLLIPLVLIYVGMALSQPYIPDNYLEVNLTFFPYTPDNYLEVNLTFDATFTEEPTDTCTYTSGDWEVDCSDNCSITSNVVIDAGKNISIVGTGTFTTDSDITGYTTVDMKGTSSSDRCTVTSLDGGGFK